MRVIRSEVVDDLWCNKSEDTLPFRIIGIFVVTMSIISLLQLFILLFYRVENWANWLQENRILSV